MKKSLITDSLDVSIERYMNLEDDNDKEPLQDISYRLNNLDVTFLDMIVSMESFLTSTDPKIRHRATSLLAEILSSGTIVLSTSAMSHILVFFKNRLSDYPSIIPCLHGIQRIIQKYSSVILETLSFDIESTFQSIFEQLHVQALAQNIRQKVFQTFHILFQSIHQHHAHQSFASSNEIIMNGILTSLEGEKDPRCLLLGFQLLSYMTQSIYSGGNNNNNSTITISDAERIFDYVSAYFPITFNPPSDNPHGITTEDLVQGLEIVLTCHELICNFSIPYFIDQLSNDSTSESIGKIYSLSALIKIANTYPSKVLYDGLHREQLAEILFQLSSHTNSQNEVMIKSQECITIFMRNLLITQPYLSIQNIQKYTKFWNIFGEKIIQKIVYNLSTNNIESITAMTTIELAFKIGITCFNCSNIILSKLLPILLVKLNIFINSFTNNISSISSSSTLTANYIISNIQIPKNISILTVLEQLLSCLDSTVDYSSLPIDTSATSVTSDVIVGRVEDTSELFSSSGLLRQCFEAFCRLLHILAMDRRQYYDHTNEMIAGAMDDHSHSHGHEHTASCGHGHSHSQDTDGGGKLSADETHVHDHVHGENCSHSHDMDHSHNSSYQETENVTANSSSSSISVAIEESVRSVESIAVAVTDCLGALLTRLPYPQVVDTTNTSKEVLLPKLKDDMADTIHALLLVYLNNGFQLQLQLQLLLTADSVISKSDPQDSLKLYHMNYHSILSLSPLQEKIIKFISILLPKPGYQLYILYETVSFLLSKISEYSEINTGIDYNKNKNRFVAVLYLLSKIANVCFLIIKKPISTSTSTSALKTSSSSTSTKSTTPDKIFSTATLICEEIFQFIMTKIFQTTTTTSTTVAIEILGRMVNIEYNMYNNVSTMTATPVGGITSSRHTEKGVVMYEGVISYLTSRGLPTSTSTSTSTDDGEWRLLTLVRMLLRRQSTDKTVALVPAPPDRVLMTTYGILYECVAATAYASEDINSRHVTLAVSILSELQSDSLQPNGVVTATLTLAVLSALSLSAYEALFTSTSTSNTSNASTSAFTVPSNLLQVITNRCLSVIGSRQNNYSSEVEVEVEDARVDVYIQILAVLVNKLPFGMELQTLLVSTFMILLTTSQDTFKDNLQIQLTNRLLVWLVKALILRPTVPNLPQPTEVSVPMVIESDISNIGTDHRETASKVSETSMFLQLVSYTVRSSSSANSVLTWLDLALFLLLLRFKKRDVESVAPTGLPTTSLATSTSTTTSTITSLTSSANNSFTQSSTLGSNFRIFTNDISNHKSSTSTTLNTSDATSGIASRVLAGTGLELKLFRQTVFWRQKLWTKLAMPLLSDMHATMPSLLPSSPSSSLPPAQPSIGTPGALLRSEVPPILVPTNEAATVASSATTTYEFNKDRLLAIFYLVANTPKPLLLASSIDLIVIVLEALSISYPSTKTTSVSYTSNTMGTVTSGGTSDELIPRALDTLELLLQHSIESVMPHLQSVLAKVTQAAILEPLATSRATALHCLSFIATSTSRSYQSDSDKAAIPYHRLHPFKKDVLKCLKRAMDDRKRSVRKVASGVNSQWVLLK